MKLNSLSFSRLVAALRATKKTCTVVEQCCGGHISSSIMAQPGASQVYFGGTVAYNTKKSKPLLLNDDALYASLTTATSKSAMEQSSAEAANKQVLSEEELYIQSKLHWTAETSVAFCKELDTDIAIAEGGASGPTFRPTGMTTGFAVIAVAGKTPSGDVEVLRQDVIRSEHADRVQNMHLFANAAADMATEVVTGGVPIVSKDNNDTDKDDEEEDYRPSSALLLDRATHLRSDPDALDKLEKDCGEYIILRGSKLLAKSTSEVAFLNWEQMAGLTNDIETRKSFLGILSTDPKRAIFSVDLLNDDAPTTTLPDPSSMSFVDTRTTAPLFVPIENELALHATALAQWQRRTGFCSLCGGATHFVDAGTCCQCTECKAKSWPRQDPSMIALISSREGNRVLLAHSARHPPKLNTVLAGFVEAGETFEAAVAREAFEETGVRVDEGSCKYIGSQPWPFPQSCMIGFTATADDTTPLVVDEKELVSAAWFEKSDVAKASTVPGATMQRPVAEAALQNDPSLPLLIPPKGVIARKLIDIWLEGGKQ